jgi:hypothetical protein
MLAIAAMHEPVGLIETERERGEGRVVHFRASVEWLREVSDELATGEVSIKLRVRLQKRATWHNRFQSNRHRKPSPRSQ